MKYLKLNHTVIFFVTICLFIIGIFAKNNWQTSRQSGDGLGYYIYLPSTLIYHDLGDFKKTSHALKKYVPNLPDLSEDIYGFRPTPTGKLADKYPVGVAILQSPFFLSAHLYASYSGFYKPDGFSRPYQVLCFFSTLFYVILGLYYLQKTLNEYYSKKVVALTIVLLGFGTNLLFFTSIFSAMSHGYQFFAVSMLIYFTNKLYNSPNLLNGMLMGIFLGLIAIIRTQDLILGLIPLLWKVGSFSALTNRIQFIFSNIKLYIFSLVGFIITISPQMIYFKFISGKWVYYSYVGETFNWTSPQIINGLFSPQNGLFMYTPIMLPIILFMVFRSKNRSVWIIPLSLILLLHSYISYSWWCWYYIAGMGSRPMVDIYPLLSFPLAGLLTWVYSKSKWVVVTCITILIFLGSQNLRFTYQQFNGHIFSEFNNSAYYWSMFLKLIPGKAENLAFNTNFMQPDPTTLIFVDTLYSSDFENHFEKSDSLIVKSGKYAVNMIDENVNITMKDLKEFDLRKGDWLKVSLDCFTNVEGFMFINAPKFVLEFKEFESSRTIWNQSFPTALISNESNSIWFTGKPKEWQNVTYFTKVPFTPNEKSTIRIIGYNPHKKEWYMDNLHIEIFKYK
ncbi:MAG: hypothetical protein IPO26_12900 [Saprospiraceae bacterium]|nr:hypothetical protein [Saprospiraceae bacterium]MBK8887985.1 hypothetical protein [Saprospiraceae bacterium]HQV67177.1 hypothetical protein [Saprospiraceae bacterium]